MRIIKIILFIISLTLGLSSDRSVRPVEFDFNQSSEQAFYFVFNASIDGIPIEVGDWIAAFKGDVCVGARQWECTDVGDSTQCYTDIPVMGDDCGILDSSGTNDGCLTAGYMLPGEYPTFKIYKTSESVSYHAIPSENVGFPQGSLAFFEIQSMDVVYDCANNLGGLAQFDNCGVCDENPENDCLNDCMGIWGGDAFYDDCGICSGGSSGHEPNSDKDECGVCFGSGEDNRGCGCFMPGPSEYWFDEDGDGFGAGESQEFCYDDLPLYWLDNDLDPEPSCFNTDLNALSVDDCGICAGENADDIGCGCFNPAPLQYWYDIDEDGLGYGDSQLFCLADLPLNWVSNDIDDQPYCSTNDTDNCGVCAGANIDDLGCGCFNPGPISYWFDEDGDGFGAGESQQYCLQDVPNSWVSNNVDPEEFCSNPDPITLMIDNCGICAGENIDDLGCGCFNPGPLDYWYDLDGDGLGFGESSQYCLENIPEGWVLNNNDLEPDCSSNDTDYCNVCGGNGLDDLGCGCFNPGPLDYWYDSDGDGLGFGESSQYCLENIPEGWVLNNNDLEPNCFTNDIDSCGVCAGANIDDLGCGCFEPGPIQYWYDSDGDGLGAGNYELYCEDSQPPGWVDNTNDESPDCNTNDIDDCGICAGNNTDKDCAGVCFGTAIIDDCNSCVGGDTGLEENYNDLGCGCYNSPAISYCEDTDGDGLGTEGTDTYFCLADLTDSWVANCTDPEPECFSNNTDTCGVCNGGNLDDLGCGCFLPGPIEYWFDSDGDELGSGEPSLFCINQQPNGWVLNTDDLFPDCFDNFYDHCGICGGDGSDDLGCGCFEPEAIEYCEDSDFDGLGSPGTETEFCLDDIPENWLINCSDPYPECDGEVDYCGVCNGNGLDDLGCGCFQPAALSYWEDIDNDGLGFGDSIDFCLSDIPTQWVQNNNDLEPECNSNDTDQCGVCAGDNSTCSGCMDQLAYNYDCLPDNIPDQGEGCGDNITIDNGTCIYRPEEFDFNQSTTQVFYFIELADISNDSLSYFEDWIGAFKDDVCVGSIPWTGAYTTVPAMGNDNTEWTQDYLVPGDFPTFKIYDSSDDIFYDTEVIFNDSYNGYYQNNDFYTINSMRALVPDCAGIAGGSSFIDECGNCICGYRVGTNNEENGGDLILSSDDDSVCDDQLFGEVLPYDNRPCTQDCHGIYGGLAIVDNCGMCSEGETGVIANADNLGCGCFVEGPQDYWFDADGDSLGSGDSVSLCLDDVTDVWVQNSDDIEPLCETNDTDDCGICSGGNMDKDCAGICFGTSLIDECGECGGDGTSCLAPFAESQSLNLSEDSSISLTLTGYNVSENHSSLDFLIVSNPINGSLSGNLPTLTYTPNLNFNGLDSFEFIVTNNQYSSEPALVSLSIAPENDAPITYDLQQTLLENQSLEIEFIGMDIDGDTITFNLISGPSNGLLEYDDELLSYIYTPNENYFGLDSFLFTAFDGQIESVPATAYLTIEGVNNPPDVVEIPNQIMNEDDSLYININATDVEGDNLIYSANTNDNADIVMDGSIILIIPEQDYNGLLEVFISVNDGQDASVQQIDISVLPINDAPVLGTILAQNTIEDYPIDIALDLFDVDQDILEIIVESSDNAIFEINSDTLSIIPNQDYFGQFIVDLYVTDGELVDSGEFTVFVSSINDSPQLSFIGSQSIEEDSTLTLQLFSDDAEGDEITFTASSNGNSLVSINEDILIVQPNENYFGDIVINVNSSDGSATDTETFILSVVSVNDPPSVSIINDIYIDEDSSASFRVVANDVDSDSLIYSAIGQNLAFDISDELITIIPNQNLSGIVEVSVLVSDGNLVSTTNFNLNINEINDSPQIIQEIDNLTLYQNGDDFLIDLTQHFYDVENGHNLEYSIFENHQAVVVTISDSNLRLSLEQNTIGSGFVSVTASDNLSRDVASINFEVNVLPVNQAPIVNDMILNIDEDEEIVFELDASDESSELEVSLLNEPSNGTISSINGLEVSYIPNQNYFGLDEIQFSISDGELYSELSVEIEILSINDSPSFITSTLADATELSEYIQYIEFNDMDGENNAVILSIAMGPQWLETDGNNLVGTPSGNDSGDYEIILILDDGQDITTATYDLTVINLNELPVASDLNLSLQEDSSISFTLFAFDGDGDFLTYSLTDAQNGTISGTSPNMVYTPNSNYYGTDYFTYSAFDGIGASNNAIVSINVQPINDSPTSNDVVFEVSETEFLFDLTSYVTDVENDDLSINSIPPSTTDTLSTVFGGRVIPQGENIFTYEHAQGISGADFLLYKANDGISESSVSMITFNLYGRSWSRNNPPSAFNDDVNILEDNSIDISLIGFDVFNEFPQDGSETVLIVQEPINGVINSIVFSPSSSSQLAEWIVNYTPADNFSGTDEIRFTVENPNNLNGNSEIAVISINVSDVNDLPTFANVESIEFNEDENAVVELEFLDVDNDLLITFEDNEYINIQLASSNSTSAQLLVSSEANYYGVSSISIFIQENQENGVQISQNVSVQVNSINDPPILDEIPNLQVNEDESATIQLDASDLDFVSFDFSISNSNHINSDLIGNQLTLTPSPDWNGNEEFTVFVEDNLGLIDSQIFTLTVLPVNDFPSATSQSTELIEDGVALISPQGSDLETEDLTYLVFDQPENGSISYQGSIFIYTPNSDYNGQDTFTYVSDDGDDLSEPALVTLNILPDNDIPILNTIEEISLNEDSNTDIVLSAVDIDGDLLTFSIVNVADEIGATIVSNILSISPISDYNGSGEIVIQVSDGEYEDTQSTTINIIPTNDSPIINEIDNITLNEGSDTTIEMSAFDIDGDELIFTALSDDTVELTIDHNLLSILIPTDAGDSEIIINVTVQDGISSDLETFSVFTQNLNDPPITLSSNYEVDEDSELSIIPEGSDPDGDAITFFVGSSTQNGTLTIEDGHFLYIPNQNFIGLDSFTYFANDGEYDSDISTISILINNVNDPPILSEIDNQNIQEGQTIEIDLNANDIDEDLLSFSVLSVDGFTSNIIGNILTISPDNENFNGEVNFTVLVNDGELEDSESFKLFYLPVNDVPQISSISDAVILEDQSFITLIETFDFDNDTIDLSAEISGNASVSIDDNLLTITPNTDFNGMINISVSASDSEFTVYSSFTLEVTPVNDAPTIDDIDMLNAYEDTEFIFEINVNDIDDISHSFSLSMDTTFVNYSISDNIVSIVPMQNWFGEVIVSVSASDEEFTATESFVVNYQSINDTPQIISSPVLSATEDIQYEYQIEVYDPDNTEFYFQLYGPGFEENDNLVISDSGLVTWTPEEGITSSGIFYIQVWDVNIYAENEFTTNNLGFQVLNITVEPVNDPPSIDSSPNTSAVEDELYTYQLTATDIDSEYFTYGLIQSPEGMSITSDGLIEWIPTEGIYSSDIVIASVFDNHPINPITSYQQFLIVVTPVNDAPIITSIADTIATVGELYTYNVEVYDPDDDHFLYILFNEPEGMNISDSGEITWVPNIPGDYANITIAVSDGGEDNVQPVEEIFIVVVEAASPLITMDFELLHEANLISFMGIPEDSTVSSIFEPLIGNAQSLIGQSIASSYNETLGWIGALTTVSPTMGYWLKLNHPPVESFIVEAYPTNPHQVYNLKEGANIISYVGIDEMPVGDAIPDQYEERFMQDAICESCGIIGESEATILHPSLGWLGSLNTLYNLNGYWVIVDEDLDFNWHIPEDQELIRETSISSFVKKLVPFEFQYAQSTQQAFYFVEEISIQGNDLNTDDWLIAYSNNTIVGAKQWGGLFTDIPVMGADGYDDTFGYIEAGMTPKFKLYRESTGELIDLYSNQIEKWKNNGLYFVNLSTKECIPQSVRLKPAYPNPFNPNTQISFDLSVKSHVEISIYDINGRLVEILNNKTLEEGAHSFMWNANLYSSGIYFLNLTTPEYKQSQKLILIK